MANRVESTDSSSIPGERHTFGNLCEKSINAPQNVHDDEDIDRFYSGARRYLAKTETCANDSESCMTKTKPESAFLIHHCRTCLSDTKLEVDQLLLNYEEILHIDPVKLRVKSVMFTDCANAYSSINSITAGSVDKAMRLHLAYIRDNSATNILSFCDAVFNISDVGAKLGASTTNWKRFLSKGVCYVSFVGGKRL